MDENLPANRTPLTESPFVFHCHAGVTCFTICCRKVDLILYPYDVIRLKQFLGIDSEEFMRRHSMLVRGDNPYFPTVLLGLTEEGRGDCPFLQETGCSVYSDRPTACRTYPLERAVEKRPDARQPQEHWFLLRHDYCKGHEQEREFTVREWVRNQRLESYSSHNDRWAEMDAIFRTNPWQGEGSGGPRQQLAFMICYNIDGFRRHCDTSRLLEQFRLPRDRKRRIAIEDEELLIFGYDYLKLLLTGKSPLLYK